MSKQVLAQLVLLRSDETFTYDVRLLPKEFDEKVAKLNFPVLGAELNVPTQKLEWIPEQPWLALDYSDRKRTDQLSSWCKVGGVPSFVVFDKNGTLITRDGRAAVSGDPTGDDFPWYPT